MSRFRSRFSFAAASVALALAAPTAVIAQAAPEPAPAIDAQGRPAEIPVKAFASQLKLGGAKLSQTGRRLAMTESVDGKMLVRIYDASTRALERTVEVADADNFLWFKWAGDNRILLSVIREDKTALYWAQSSRLLVVDVATGALSYVGLARQGQEGDDLLYTDPAGSYVLLSLNNDGSRQQDVWRLPLDGNAEQNGIIVQEKDRDIDEWYADSAGVVRLGIGITGGGSVEIFYRSGPGQEFTRVTKFKAKDEAAMDAWDIIGIRPGSDLGYAFVKTDDGRKVLREVDYRTGEPGRIVFEDPRWDAEEVVFDKAGKAIGSGITEDSSRRIWFTPEMQRAQADLEAALGVGQVRIISVAEQGRMLVLQDGPDDPGGLYIYSPNEKRLDFFANLRPKIDFRLLAKGQAFDVPTRDGGTMRSYLTLPRGRGDGNFPLVIMPHGGPFGVRDTLDYQDWVQLLANRGYAVVQPNYRGSGGFGKAYEDRGEGEIGRRMQDDLDDAVAWAVAQGHADPARVCIFGASYGGYAALWAVIRNPDIYRCAASWAGVTDWDRQLAYDKDYLGNRFYREKWKPIVRGKTRNFDLSDVSPVAKIRQLDRPVLLAHGRKDKRVPFRQFEVMTKAAERNRKTLETLALDDGHSIADEENEEKLLIAVVDFLQRHNPAD
ncbi:alpha/beta hydrolase family protein [Qipengyuania marisflavi]|uniref:S9 family peptidase n=1 Tax=Qipengyuania marisflavi TaxID=2486356 RepID=A0A5S3P9S7_9SPHN|nr:alpha/beta fold hydrolase [Qipengyuania marisflavi]TMM50254.1 S9 family peptidase [Qipengyuania marisflavi]